MALEPLTALLSAAILVISIFFLLNKYGAKRRRVIALVDKLPGPPTWPLVGSVMEILVPRNQFMGVVNRHYNEYKPLYKTWTGPYAEIHVTLPEHIEKMIGGIANIEKSAMYNLLHPWLGEGLLTSTGSKWHARRKMITPSFHFSILEPFCDVFMEKSKVLVEKLQLEMETHGEAGFDVYPFITRCTLDIICETAMGTEIQAQEQTESEYVRAIHDISYLILYRAIRPWLLVDFAFNLTAAGRRYNHCLKVLHGFTDKVIHERREEQKTTSKVVVDSASDNDAVLGKKKRLAFLDLLLQASCIGENQLSDTDIREEVDTFMFEGHDTTTAGISWALYMLGLYPEVQAKAYEELESIFHDSDRPITMRDLQEMKYLERVIKETLRLYPSVPFIMRTLEEDVECGGYTLPKGVMINIHIYHLHQNPDYFPNPTEFNPDNFLPDRVQGRHPYAYIPFSAGPRNCVGQKFALLEEKTVLAAVLRRFRLRSLETRDQVNMLSELVLKPENGIKMAMTPRKSGLRVRKGEGTNGVKARVYY